MKRILSQYKNDLKRWCVVALLAIICILCGSGCRNIKTLEADLGGLDIEYYPSHPSQEKPSIFDWGITTNKLRAMPVLMEMDNGKYK